MQKLILLPGWGMDSNVWSPVTEALSEYFELFYCDWYGVNSADEYKARVFSMINGQADGCFSLLGWSLGSLLAIEAACRYKNGLKQLILVSGTSRFIRDRKSGYSCGWPQNVVERMKPALHSYKQKTLSSFYGSMFSEKEKQQGYDEKFMEITGKLANKYEAQELEAGLDFLIQADCREKLQEIKTPVLIIHGGKDAICPVSASEYISTRIKGDVFFKTLAETGHIPFYTKAEEFSSLIKAFIERGK